MNLKSDDIVIMQLIIVWLFNISLVCITYLL